MDNGLTLLMKNNKGRIFPTLEVNDYVKINFDEYENIISDSLKVHRNKWHQVHSCYSNIVNSSDSFFYIEDPSGGLFLVRIYVKDVTKVLKEGPLAVGVFRPLPPLF